MFINPVDAGLRAPKNMVAFQKTSSIQHQTPVFTGKSRADVVHFGRTRKELFAEYGINPDNVRVKAPEGVEIPKKEIILAELIKTHEHARKNKLLGNYSGRQYASGMLFANGQWERATNIENSRDLGILCGERSALVMGWNKALSRLKLRDLEDPDKLAKAQAGLRVKMLVMTSPSKPGTDPTAGNPCSECQTWLATDKYFGRDTLIATLDENASVLSIRKLSDLMPFKNITKPSLTDKAVDSLPFAPEAEALLAQRGVSKAQVVETLKAAKAAFDENEKNRLARFSGKNTGCGFLFSSGDITNDSRMDFTARWFDPADLSGAAAGFKEVYRRHPELPKGSVKLNTVAYYGKDPEQPSTLSLGVLAQPAYGGDTNTLVAVIENDTIQVRTIQQYQKNIYISRFEPKEPL